MPLEDLKAWGWRIPFFMGGILGIVSVFLRRLLRETPYFREAKEYGFLVKEPIFRAVHKYKKMLILGIGLFVLDTVGFNLIILFSSSYFVNVLNFTYSEAFAVNVFTIAVLLVATPLMGYLSIKQGVKKVAIWSAWALVILALPAYFIMNQKVVWMAFVCQGLLAFCLAAYLSCLPALICMLFPVEVRYSGTSLSVNLGLALFGGAGPFIMTYLINRLDTPLLPSFYLIIGALISLLCLSKLPKKSG
jgi:MHS family proline/betaine transporter-like MFS transporter